MHNVIEIGVWCGWRLSWTFCRPLRGLLFFGGLDPGVEPFTIGN